MSEVLITGPQGFSGGFDYMLDEVNSWIENAMAEGKI